MLLVLLCLVTHASLAGLTDSVMSPYLCPLVRQHTQGGDTLCGLIISARFGTHIVFILLLGQVISRVGARRMFLTSVGICALFNMILSSIVWIEDDDTFTALTFLFIILSMIGDSGVFCTIYVLAGKTSVSLRAKEEEENQMTASGPAWVETLYGCGSMLGPPLGGIVFLTAGFAGVILSVGGCMAITGLVTAFIFYTEDRRREENTMALVEDRRSSGEPRGEDCPLAAPAVPGDLSYLTALQCPPVSLCCVLQVSSGLASSWYLSSLQKYLSSHLSLSTQQIGLVYMSQSLVYTLLTPGLGLLLDRGWPRLPFLYLGLAADLTGYLLLSQPGLAFSVCGLMMVGLGQALTLITCLNIMMAVTQSASRENNAAKVASLWESCEMIGGYLGSSCGGLTSDTLGFSGSTALVSGVFAVLLLGLALFNILYLRHNSLESLSQTRCDNSNSDQSL